MLAEGALPEARPDLRSMAMGELSAFVEALGEKPYRARQLFRWMHQRRAATFDEMTDLSKALREKLASRAGLTTLSFDLCQASSDGSEKYRFVLADGAKVEAVYMPESSRKTLCLSTQVGCAMGCAFCMTGRMGLVRNLTAGEIVEQVHRVNAELFGRDARANRPLTNLVFMGMGEPLQNFANVMAALEILQHEDGPQFSHRHITVSTSGIVPMIERLGAQSQVKLAISLNASTDEMRDRLMPINRRWNLAALMEACRRFPLAQGRMITLEYVLLDGINDSLQDGERLAALLKGLSAKVNLIAYNENPGLPFRAPSAERVEALRLLLLARGVNALARKSRGRDIAAACGQLAATERA